MKNKEPKKKQVQDHDFAYKLIFKFVAVVRGLIEYCSEEKFSEEKFTDFDFDNLTECSSEFFTEERERRLVDSLWSLPYGSEGKMVMFALIEFQKTLPRHLPWRMFEYVFVLYQTWFSKYGLSRPLPIVLPIVIYSGPPRKQKFKMNDIQFLQGSCPDWMKEYQPRLKFEVIDMNDEDGSGEVSDNVFLNLKYLVQSTSQSDLGKRQADVLKAMSGSTSELKAAIEKWSYWVVTVRYIKDRKDLLKQINEEKIMTKGQKILHDFLEESRQKGREEVREEVVVNLLKAKMPDSDICAAANLTADELNQIKQEMAA